jgi:hypothetical protein
MDTANDIGEKINSGAMRPMRVMGQTTFGNPADLPRWGDVIPFMGCCCYAQSCYVSVSATILNLFIKIFFSSKLQSACLAPVKRRFAVFVSKQSAFDQENRKRRTLSVYVSMLRLNALPVIQFGKYAVN